MTIQKPRMINTKTNEEGLSRLTMQYLRRIMVKAEKKNEPERISRAR
jgi:hypothetical protein